MAPPQPLRQFISNLPLQLRFSWFGMALGFLVLAAGYSLRSRNLSYAGALAFTAAYTLGFADYRLRRKSRDKAVAFHAGLAIAPVAAGYFHLFMLLIGLIAAGIMAWATELDRSLALRLLHFWVVSLSFAIFLMVTKVARRPLPGPRR